MCCVFRQSGSVAIEFALMFPLLFVIFYAAVSYGMVFMVNQGMVFAAEEGARAAIRVEDPEYLEAVVTGRVGESLDWLPSSVRSAIVVTVSGPDGSGNLEVNVSFPSTALPLVPLTLPFHTFTVPDAPDEFAARALIALSPEWGL